MGRILKMDFHRLFHSIIFYSVPLAELLILVIAFFVDDSKSADVSLGEAMGDVVSFINYIILMCINIVMIWHWNAEHKHGFIKNYAGNVNGRHKLAIEKMIVATVAYVIYYISAVLFILLDYVINGVKIRWEPLGDMKWTMLLWFLIGIGTLAISLFLYELTHSTALGYVFAIFLSLGVVEELLVQIIYIINSKFETWRYLLIMGIQAEENTLAVNLIRTILYILVFFTGAAIVTRKKDVKV